MASDEELLSIWHSIKPVTAVPEQPTGIARYTGLLTRGATLGALGGPPAETIPEHLTEFAGSIPTWAAISTALSPLTAGALRAAPLLNVPPVQRLLTAAGTGAVVGAGKAIATGEPVLSSALEEAALAGAAEGAWLGAARALRKTPVVPASPRSTPQVPIAAKPMAVAAPTIRSQPEPIVKEAQVAHGLGQPPPTPQAQLELQIGKQSPKQLALPMALPLSGRTRRYEVATRYKGTFPSQEVAAREAASIARAAQAEGVAQVKVLTRTPEAVEMRTFAPGAQAFAPPAKTSKLSAPAVLAAERVPAQPMRRYEPSNIFDVQIDPQIGEPVLIPRSDEVEAALKIAAGIDPRQIEIPLTKGQVSFLVGEEGRGVRAKLEISKAQEMRAPESIAKMSEDDAAKLLLEAPAPPANAPATIRFTEKGSRTESLLARSGVSEEEVMEFMAGLPKGTSTKMKVEAVKAFLKERCR